jgi:hypothetical protein
MSSRTAALVWLMPGLLCVLLACLAFGGGGYSIWHTHGNVALVENRMDRDEKEIIAIRGRAPQKGDFKKLQEIDSRRHSDTDELNEFRDYRFYAIAITLSGILPLLLCFPFIIMALVKFMKKKRPAQEPSDDEEPEIE